MQFPSMRARARDFFEKRKFWISQFIFLALILFSLRDVLALPGTVGRTWDWEIPGFPEQIFHQISRYFFIWDYQFRGGFYSPYRPEGLFYFFTLPLAPLGGEGFTKGAIIILLLLSANTMRWLTHCMIGLSAGWSVLAGALYMFSPAFYSRLMAGHLHMLTPYALLPLFFGVAWQTFHRDDKHIPARESIATGVLFALEAIHPSYLFMAAILLGLIVLMRFFQTGITRVWIVALVIIGTVFSLVSTFWALPSITGYLATGTLFHSGWPMQQPDLVTPSSVVAKQAKLYVQAISAVFDALRMNSESGFTTEYGYPVPEKLAPIWLFASFVIPLVAFASLLYRKSTNRLAIVLTIVGLFGIAYIAGTNFIAGAMISSWLLMNVFPVWAQFATTLRMLPLVALMYAALVPSGFGKLTQSLGQARGKIIGGIATVVCAIFVSPFLAGDPLIDVRQVFALGSYQSTNEDRQVYDFLKNAAPGSRVSYTAPPLLYNAQFYDLGAAWMGGLSPQPEFLLPYFDEEAWRGAANLRGNPRESLTAKMLGLGAVEYLVFPHGKFIYPYPTLYPKTIPVVDLSTARRQFEQGIASQKNLVKVNLPLSESTIYRNESAVPRIYAATQATLVHGNSDALLDFVDSSMFDQHAVFFIDGRQPIKTLGALASQVDRIIISGDNAKTSIYPAALSPSYLITKPVSGNGIALNVPRETQYVARVRVAPYQFIVPTSNDKTQATFAKPSSEVENWISNVLFDYAHDTSANLWRVRAYLNGENTQSEFVQYEQTIEPFDLTENSHLRITSQVTNVQAQAIQIVLGLDFDGDSQSDAEWRSEPLARANLKTDFFDVFNRVRREFPGKDAYQVVSVGIRFQKSESPTRPKSALGFYTFTIGAIEFFRNPSDTQPTQLFSLPTLSSSRDSTLSLSFDATPLATLPAYLEYRVDGPATLETQLSLLIKDSQGNPLTLPVASRLLDPFAEGVIEINLRDAIDQAQVKLDKATLELAAHRLTGNRELRPTTLTLTRLGIPNSSKISTEPKVIIDGTLIALTEIENSASRVTFSTSAFALSAGPHRVNLEIPNDAPYKFDSLEIEPASSPSQPAPIVTFRQINPTRFIAHVENARAPFFLVFSESYHDEWKAFTREPGSTIDWYTPSALLSTLFESDRREVAEHYRANGYANGWRMTKLGRYDVVIEFIPQRLYEGGWFVSLATLFAAVIFLAWNRFQRRGGNPK